MAGYKYRATDAKIRAAEELMRSRGINDVQADATKPTPVLAAPAPEAKNGDVFEVVKETPRPVRMPRRAGTVRVAAASAAKVLEESPGEWFRVAKRDTKSKAYSYTATLRQVTDKPVQTRIVDEDDAFIVYARIKAKEAKK